jgi:beta-lactamase regulating signal transducer with metallopeptidase domain
MKNKKTKVTFSAGILALSIAAFLTFWLIPSNLVFADDRGVTPPVITLNGVSSVNAVAGTGYADAGANSSGEAISVNSITAPGGAIKDFASTGIDPIMPISWAAAAITGLIIVLVSLRKRQYRKWKRSLGYYTKDDA